jgi:hypothetical protein
MAYHGLALPGKISAQNLDVKNRSVINTADEMDNGFVVVCSALTAASSEVWTALKPSSSNGLVNLWMVWDAEIAKLADGATTPNVFRGLSQDPRLSYWSISQTVSAFKLMPDDEVWLTDECLAGTQGSNTFVNATDSTGGYKMYWGSTQTGSVTSFKLLGDHYVSIPTGAIGTNRVTIHRFSVLA